MWYYAAMNLNEILAMDSMYNLFVDSPEPDPHIVAATDPRRADSLGL